MIGALVLTDSHGPLPAKTGRSNRILYLLLHLFMGVGQGWVKGGAHLREGRDRTAAAAAARLRADVVRDKARSVWFGRYVARGKSGQGGIRQDEIRVDQEQLDCLPVGL
jgi:hypothetical protein